MYESIPLPFFICSHKDKSRHVNNEIELVVSNQPLMTKTERSIRDKKILLAHNKGLKVSELIIKYALGKDRINSIIARQKHLSNKKAGS